MSRYELGDGTYSDQYKVGDKFTFTGLPREANTDWTPEDLEGLFEFVFDDESCCPKFKSFVSGMEAYEDWCLLSKYTEVEPTKEDTQAYDSELTEALAKIDTLESALEDTVRELISLREGSNTAVIDVDNSEFKPINEMTLGDWELANEERWVFELNNGEKVFVQGIMEEFDSEDFPVELSDLGEGTHAGIVTVDGCFFPDQPANSNSVKQRIK